MPVKVVGRSPLMTELLRSTFEKGGYEVDETAATVQQLRDVVDGDTIVIHALISCKRVPQSVAFLRDNDKDVKIVVLCASASLDELRETVGLSANVILPDTTDLTKVLASIELVASGLNVIHPSQLLGTTEARPDETVDLSDRPSPNASAVHLSIKEGDVLRGLELGLSNKAIGKNMGIKEATVKVHLRSIFQKIGVNNRTQAALWGKTNGLRVRMNASSPESGKDDRTSR